MSDICVIGGINMDLVVRAPHLPRAGETVLGGDFTRCGGGKGANQALAARRLGASVRLLGQVGADPFGEELLRRLVEEGVETGGVRPVPGQPTGVAFIVVAASGENAIVVAPGANLTWDEAGIAQVEGLVASCRLLVVNLEVAGPVVARAIRSARAAGARVLLNPAPYRPEDQGVFADVDLLLPNQIEAAQCAGVDPASVTDWAAIGRKLLAGGPQSVIITLGAEGALLVEPRGVTHIPGFRVAAIDTTAAGDAFVGGLAVATLRGLALPEAVRFANACGAVAATRAGAQPSLPHPADVDALLDRERS
jgi:ribokinase